MATHLLSTNAIINYTFNTNAYLMTDYGNPDSINAFIEAVAELDVILLSQSYYDNLLTFVETLMFTSHVVVTIAVNLNTL